MDNASMSDIRTKVIDILCAEQDDHELGNSAERSLSRERLEELINPNLFAGTVVSLPKEVLTQAQDLVRATFLRRQTDAGAWPVAEDPVANFEPGNYSILMSYDFHLNEKNLLKLIEINTNAAFLAVGDLMYRAAGLPQPVPDFKMDEIRENILEELRLFGRANPKPRVAIVDENPEMQRLFIEFLVYQKLFRNWGWDCEIQDVGKSLEHFDFVYNRSTDFYFTHESAKDLRQRYLAKELCVSPNPREYYLLADKQRLNEWSSQPVDEKIRSHLLKSFEVTEKNTEEAWSLRKGLFFKPVQSFGSKQSFKGASISRKLFDEIRTSNRILAQEYLQAPEIRIGEQLFKYDLRFYAYKDRVQSVVARLYQGQVTNLKTPGGGFAPVHFV